MRNFGHSVVKGCSKWCDMGSQVLSALDCDGDHPNACTSGHGMDSKGKFYLKATLGYKFEFEGTLL